MLTILLLSICRYNLYGGEVMAKADTIKIDVSIFCFYENWLVKLHDPLNLSGCFV